MISFIKKFIKPFICFVFVLCSMNLNAQVSLLQNAIDKLENYKNFSYQFTNKHKDFTIDTTIKQNKELFLKAHADTVFGYLFKLETVYKTEKFTRTDLYNGKNLIYINPEDSTYEIQTIKHTAFQGTLLDNLNWIKNFTKKKPSKFVKASDTTINGVINTHLIVNTYDTVIDKEHYYTLKHLFIDKQSGVPTSIITKSRNKNFGNGISDYYDEIHYSNYKFDQENVDIATFTMPKGFHLLKVKPAPPAVLTAGTVAPDWTLYTADGKKTSLTQMKGKVVLLDFYFIGCIPCMDAIKPLNKLYEKYKDKNIVIASVTERDSKKSVLAFKKQYGIKYPGYVDATDVVKSYHVNGFPTFYFIDKEGKIANVTVGYSGGFEEKVTSIINNLLKK